MRTMKLAPSVFGAGIGNFNNRSKPYTDDDR